MNGGNLREFYLTSPMREGVLCWYPFKQGASALDLTGGALTRLIKSRCGRVVTGGAKAGERFDYVIVIDPDDFSVNALKAFRSMLNSRGRLLMAYENPFALRYWNGKESPKTGMPYSSLLGRDGRAGMAETRSRLKQAGFEGQKWYYPLTDHWFTREVYSESFLPGEYLNNRFIAYIEAAAGLKFDERALYREVIRGGAFEFMCGAYLAEARVFGGDDPCPVDYAAVTAYREPGKRFATTVRNDGKVYKTPLHPSGRAGVSNTAKNHADLAELGINVLKTEEDGGALVMPRVNLPTLWDYWTDKLSCGTFDFNEMAGHFDRIRDYIYKASANGRCYWEMVPANCFYDADRDEMTFFDQEYYWENVSPDIAVARALWAVPYSAAFSRDKRSAAWLEALKERYGLSRNWNELVKLAEVKTREEVFGGGCAVLEAETLKSVEQIRNYESREMSSYARRRRFGGVSAKLRGMSFKNPIVYGYGRRGRDLSAALKESGMEPAAVVDKALRAYPSADLVPARANADVIIVSVLEGAADIKEELKRRLALPVFTLEELLNERS